MAALGTRLLDITVGGTSYKDQAFNAEITSQAAESDQQTFAEAATGGGREYRLKVVMTQDLATTGLWDKIWSAAGTSVAVIVKPYGNATATATQPHYSGNVIVSEPDGTLVGGDADSNATARWQTEVEWVFTAKPTKLVA